MSSWLWFSRWVHISNAELGTYNPQLVSSCMFTVGYTWFNEEGILRHGWPSGQVPYREPRAVSE
jgi:hypothetical protein